MPERRNVSLSICTEPSRKLRDKNRSGCRPVLPVSRRGAQFRIVLDFGLRPTGPHGGHAAVNKGKGDHLAAFTSRKNLGMNCTGSKFKQ